MLPTLTSYRRDKVMLILIVVLFISPLVTSYVYPTERYDVIIFGATPAGFAAALAAKASGVEKVLLLEPTAHVGGMASPGGIGLRDCDLNQIRTNNSTQYEWGMRNARFYGVDEPVWQPDNWVGEQSFLEMLNESDVELRLNTTFVEGSDGIQTTIGSDGMRRISAIQLETGEWIGCKYIIDASYEGEVMTSSGYVTYTYGRESKEQYNESFAGVGYTSIGQFPTHIFPYYPINKNKEGVNSSPRLFKWIQNGPDPRTRIGQADQNLMAYSFRACLTKNESNMVPFQEPPGYDSRDFELAQRLLEQEIQMNKSLSYPWSNLDYRAYPKEKSMKYDACCGSSPVGIDAAGLAVGYASGSRAKRKEIYDLHRYYVQGLMWFWVNDSSVPDNVREEMNSAGLCKDEWPDNDHFPPQLYVREASRLVGDRVYTQNDRVCRKGMVIGCRKDSISLGSWAFDIHEMQRVVVKDSAGDLIVYNEGLTRPSQGGNCIFEIPYYVLLPKRQEMVNLAVPNCPSVSHVAFAAIREEPTLWQLGQAAGTAAGIAVSKGGKMALQDVNYQDLQAELIEQHTFVHWFDNHSHQKEFSVSCPVEPSTTSPHPESTTWSAMVGQDIVPNVSSSEQEELAYSS